MKTLNTIAVADSLTPKLNRFESGPVKENKTGEKKYSTYRSGFAVLN